MLFGKKGVVGLDIGSNAIKLVELKESRSGFELKSLGEAILPPEAIVNKVIINSSAVVEAISSLAEELRIGTKNVVTSISGHSVIIKKITLPRASEEELEESIQWELEQYIPHNISDINYDFQILPGEATEGNMDVLLVAAKKDITNDYTTVITEAGLNPVILDVDVFALENMYEVNYQIGFDEVVALVDIGASVTNINVLRGGISVSARDISVGGKQFTEWIQKELDLNYDNAEKMKLSMGSGEAPAELDRVARDFTDLVCGEIQKTLDFFTATSYSGPIQKMVLGGGSSKVLHISSVLTDRMRIPVEIVNPFRNIRYDQDKFDSEYILDIAPKAAVATGLAMRRLGDK